MIRFREYFLINEVKDSKSNVAQMMKLYGYDENEARDIIKLWNKVAPWLQPEHSRGCYGGDIEKYSPKDIFAHGMACQNSTNPGIKYTGDPESYRKLVQADSLERGKDIIAQRIATGAAGTEDVEWDGKGVWPDDMIDRMVQRAVDDPEKHEQERITRMQFDARQGLEGMLKYAESQKMHKEEEKTRGDDYTIVYQNDMVTVYEPHSMGASCKLGRGTRWCTAATQGNNMFYDYVQRGVRLFYFVPKDPEWNEKMAVAFGGDLKGIEAFDSSDNEIGAGDPFEEYKVPFDILPLTV